MIRSTEQLCMPMMTAKDDAEAYLESFKRMASVAVWDPDQWASQLGPLLIGPTQATYKALSRAAANDYNEVKKAILHRLGIASIFFGNGSGPRRTKINYQGCWPSPWRILLKNGCSWKGKLCQRCWTILRAHIKLWRYFYGKTTESQGAGTPHHNASRVHGIGALEAPAKAFVWARSGRVGTHAPEGNYRGILQPLA